MRPTARWFLPLTLLAIGCSSAVGPSRSSDGASLSPDLAAPRGGPERADGALPVDTASDSRINAPDAGKDLSATAPPDTAGPGDAPPSIGGCRPGGKGFDTSTAGVAVDLATCLAWQREDPPKPMGACLIARDSEAKLCFSEATRYCQTLMLGGQSGWRMPTQAELRTIVVGQSYPAVDKTTFPQTLLSLYWTSEQHGEKVLCLDFSNAGTANPNIGPDGPQGVRCVRGPVP
jgi:hypothetical protein